MHKVISDEVISSNPNWRILNLHPDYEYKHVPEHGLGRFPVHRKTGEVCCCRMKWNEDGSVLACPVCGLDGT